MIVLPPTPILRPIRTIQDAEAAIQALLRYIDTMRQELAKQA